MQVQWERYHQLQDSDFWCAVCLLCCCPPENTNEKLNENNYFQYFKLHLTLSPCVSSCVPVNCFPSKMHLPTKCMSTVWEIQIPFLHINTRTRTYFQLCPVNDLAGDCSCNPTHQEQPSSCSTQRALPRRCLKF